MPTTGSARSRPSRKSCSATPRLRVRLEQLGVDYCCGGVANPIHQMEHEHDGAGALLVNMRQTTANDTSPDDACQTFSALYDALEALEADLHEHIHLENNVLFPASLIQEQMV